MIGRGALRFLYDAFGAEVELDERWVEVIVAAGPIQRATLRMDWRC